MLHRLLTATAAALVFAIVAAAPQPAAAHWPGAPAALGEVLTGSSDLEQVRHRRWRHHLWWGAPLIAAPFVYHHYYGRPYYGDCDWVLVRRWRHGHRVHRRAWRCW